jgi:hypothetical protein
VDVEDELLVLGPECQAAAEMDAPYQHQQSSTAV